jgi:hypothetical protein
MRSWHDYHLVAYSVDGLNRQIQFDVRWPYDADTDIDRATVLFSEVEGYFFEHDLGGNILDSITEVPVDAFLTHNADYFEQECKWGWPLFWRGDVTKTLEYLNDNAIKCLEISSSHGLSGWVLASNVAYFEHRTTL